MKYKLYYVVYDVVYVVSFMRPSVSLSLRLKSPWTHFGALLPHLRSRNKRTTCRFSSFQPQSFLLVIVRGGYGPT
jgi:hypothetical protein